MDNLSSNLELIDKNIDHASKFVVHMNKQIEYMFNMRNQICDWDKMRYYVNQNCHNLESIRKNQEGIRKNQEYQQQFLEELDERSRENRLFIRGLPENDVESPLGKTDQEKLESILEKMDISCSDVSVSMRRCGAYSDMPRPLQLTLDCPKICREILNNVYKLKNDDNYSYIYIDKELHPTVHYELGRLRIRRRREQNKAENRNSHIHYDKKKRILIKNGEIIDRFSPSFV